jgi:hypothetical protein
MMRNRKKWLGTKKNEAERKKMKITEKKLICNRKKWPGPKKMVRTKKK